MNTEPPSAPDNPPPRRGILLVNLGSPDAPTVPAVRRYLNEFLMDKAVVDLPWPIRRLLVSAFILPTRPKASAAAYASIWREGEPGSPLVYHSERTAQALRAAIDVPVALAMRYGRPSIADGLALLADCDHILLIAAYPHHADSTRTTTIEATRALLQPHQQLAVLPPFYADSAYIEVLSQHIERHMPPAWDHLLFSYHGLPERHLTKADPTGGHCLQRPDCCEAASPAHATCYRHQVFATTAAVCKRLGITAERHTLSFQSRLGRTPWLTPYTDEVLPALAADGVRHLAVTCPAFVADNLETLEEIGLQGRESFLGAGGSSFSLIPCLNDDPDWVNVLARWCRGDSQPEH